MSVLQQSELSLKATVVTLCSLCVLLAGAALYRMSIEADFTLAGIAALAILLGLGLYKMQAWARAAWYAICWLMLLVIIFGYLVNPFEAMDRAAMGLEPETWQVMLLHVVPYLVACLWVIHILGKYRSRFSNPLKRSDGTAGIREESTAAPPPLSSNPE